MSEEKKSHMWEQEDEEDEQATAPGIREDVTYTTNSNGQRVKVITRVKISEVKIRVPKRVAARRNLPRFGDAKAGEDNVTMRSPDFVLMEHPADQLSEDAADPSLAKTLTNFIQKQNDRKLAMAALGSLDDDLTGALLDSKSSAAKADAPAEKSGAGKYVAPGSSGGAGLSAMMRSGANVEEEEEQETTTLRVSNLTKDATEDDLRDLFDRFGYLTRVSIPTTSETRLPRGFAYITFARREDAEKAFNKLNGFGYGNLILAIEWARPQRSSMNTSYSSGYGKKLAQDTTEKVSYFSQHNR